MLIGNGTPDDARAYRTALDADVEVFVDPELVGYSALELRRSLLANMRPSTAGAGLRAFFKGYRGRRMSGDPLQLGGVFVIDTDSRVVWSYRSKRPQDFPPIEEVLAAARSAC